MEKKIKVKVSPKNYVYGQLYGTQHQPLVIFVHGLPGSMDEDIYLEATRWFSRHGYSTFRFDFYGGGKDSRQLLESTLMTHATDIDAIVRYFRIRKFEKIFIAGHSFGGPSILFSKAQKFDVAILWDPSYDVSFTKTPDGHPKVKYIKEVSGYLMNWGVNFVIGKEMAKGVESIRWDDLTKNFHVPLMIVAVGHGALLRGAKHYFKTANDPKDLVVLKDATHYFNDKKERREELFKISDAWFKKFLK